MGNYLAVVNKNYISLSAQNKTPSVKLEIITKKDMETGKECFKTFYHDLWITPTTIKNTANVLKNCFGIVDFDFEIFNKNQELLAGVEIGINTVGEEYKGKSYEKIKYIFNPSKKKIEPLPQDVIKNLSDLYKDSINAILQEGKGELEPETKPDIDSLITDDLPF